MSKVIYEGKAKILYNSEKKDCVIQYFKDDVTAYNREKSAILEGKGIINNYISEYLMLALAEQGISTHFIKRLDERRQLVKIVQIIPIEIIVRNIAAGSFSKRLGVKEGVKFPHPVIDLCYKNDNFGDPLINDDHAVVMDLASYEEINHIKQLALKINNILLRIFKNAGIILVDFKLEFGFMEGKQGDKMIILADELSPDSCRLWDMDNFEKMDKDRYRRDLGDVVLFYKKVAQKLGIKLPI